jgi:hypothetical protein
MTMPDLFRLEDVHPHLLFVAEKGWPFCPPVSAVSDDYPAIVDAATGRARIARTNRQSLRSVEEVGMPIVAQGGAPAMRLAAGSGLTRESCEHAVLEGIDREVR